MFVNQYLIIQDLGRGAHAAVKLCLNTADERLYAMKVRGDWGRDAPATALARARTALRSGDCVAATWARLHARLTSDQCTACASSLGQRLLYRYPAHSLHEALGLKP